MIGKNQKLKVSFEVDGDGNVVRAFSNITQASDRSAKSLDNTGKAAETSAAKHKRLTAAARQAGDVLGKALAGGALLAVGALATATTAVVQQGAAVERLAALSGTGTTEFQRYAAGAIKVGVEQDKLGDIFKDTQEKVGEFLNTGGGELKQFFDEIAPQVGVTAEQFRKLSGPQALELYYSTLERSNLSQSQMVTYLEAIADEATLLQPMLANNAKGFREAGDEAEKYGAILDEEALEASKALRAELQQLQLSFIGVRNEVVLESMPAITELAETMNSPEVRAGFAAIVSGLADVATFATKATTNVVNFVKTAAEGLAVAVHGVGDFDLERQEARVVKLQGVLRQIKEEQGRDIAPTRRDQLGDLEAKYRTQLAEARAELAKNTALFGGPDTAEEAATLQARFRGLPEDFGLHVNPNGRKKGGGGGDGTGGRTPKAPAAPAAPAEWDIPQYERWIQLQMEDVDALQVVGAARRDANQAIADQHAALEGFKSDMQFELELLGMTNTEREIAINQRRAGVNAMSEEGQELARFTERLAAAREQAMLVEDLKYGLADMFASVASGSQDAGDAFADFATRMKQQAAQFLADKAIEALFDMFGGDSSGGGSGGGFDWGQLIGAIGGAFGGSGGWGGVATGGLITGPGTGTSDSIPARLSNGEFVVKAASVAKYGADFMHAINAGRFADGGMVGGPPMGSPAAGYGGQSQAQPVTVIAVFGEDELNAAIDRRAKSPSGERIAVTHFQRNRKVMG